jgi:transposase
VSAADVVSIGRKFDFVKGRALFCVVATREGFRQIDVAAYLGRSHATVYHYQQIYKNGEYWLLGLVKGYDEIRK